MTSKHIRYADVISVRRKLRKLHKRAGITKQVEDASAGYRNHFYKQNIRKLYFGVADLTLRKQLIRTHGACERAWPVVMQAKLAEAQQKLARAHRRAEAPLPWLRAGFVAAMCAGVGAAFFRVYGAIAGAMVGFLAGQGIIANARVARPGAVRSAQSEVDSRLESATIEPPPELFNSREEQTGEPDPTNQFPCLPIVK